MPSAFSNQHSAKLRLRLRYTDFAAMFWVEKRHLLDRSQNGKTAKQLLASNPSGQMPSANCQEGG
jgi:hypothetical protein